MNTLPFEPEIEPESGRGICPAAVSLERANSIAQPGRAAFKKCSRERLEGSSGDDADVPQEHAMRRLARLNSLKHVSGSAGIARIIAFAPKAFGFDIRQYRCWQFQRPTGQFRRHRRILFSGKVSLGVGVEQIGCQLRKREQQSVGKGGGLPRAAKKWPARAANRLLARGFLKRTADQNVLAVTHLELCKFPSLRLTRWQIVWLELGMEVKPVSQGGEHVVFDRM